MPKLYMCIMERKLNLNKNKVYLYNYTNSNLITYENSYLVYSKKYF